MIYNLSMETNKERRKRFSTLKPMKKIDTAASQRLSTSFIGTGSVRRANANSKLNIDVFGSTPSCGSTVKSSTKSRPSTPLVNDNVPHKTPQRRVQVQAQGNGISAGPDPRSQAGRALVEQVILPVLSSASVSFLLLNNRNCLAY